MRRQSKIKKRREQKDRSREESFQRCRPARWQCCDWLNGSPGYRVPGTSSGTGNSEGGIEGIRPGRRKRGNGPSCATVEYARGQDDL